MKMNCNSCQVDGEMKIQMCSTKFRLILTKLEQFNARRMLIKKSIRHLNLIKHFVNFVENFEELMERYRS